METIINEKHTFLKKLADKICSCFISGLKNEDVNAYIAIETLQYMSLKRKYLGDWDEMDRTVRSKVIDYLYYVQNKEEHTELDVMSLRHLKGALSRHVELNKKKPIDISNYHRLLVLTDNCYQNVKGFVC